MSLFLKSYGIISSGKHPVVACIDKHVGQTLLLKVSPQNEAAREGTRSSDAPLLGLWLH
jgi:hypothetical protein